MAAISAVGMAVALGLLVLLVQSPIVRRPLLDWVTDYLAREVDLHLAVEAFDYNLITRRVTTRGVTIAALGHEQTPILTADMIEARLPWSAYLGRIVLHEVVLTGGRVTIATDANGVSNLPPSDPDALPLVEPRRLEIRGLTVRDLDIAYLNAENDVDVHVTALRTDLDGRVVQVFAGATGEIAAERVSIRVGTQQTASGPLTGRMAFDGSTVSLQEVAMDFPEADVRIGGRVLRALDSTELDLTLAGLLHLIPATVWVPLPVPVAGSATLDGTITGPLSDVVVETAFVSDDLALGDAQGLRAEGRARITTETVVVTPLTLTAGAGRAEALVTAPFGDERATTMEATWQGVPSAIALAIFEAAPLPVATALDGTATLDLGIGETAQLTADIDVRMRGVARAGVLPVDGHITARIANGRWRANVTQSIGRAVRATGEVSGAYDANDATQSTLTGPLDIRVTDPAALSRALANAGIEVPEIVATSTGEVSAALQLGGILGAPTAIGTVASEGLVLADVGPARLNFSIEASSERLHVEDLRLVASDTTIDAGVDMNLASGAIDGAFRFEAPDLQQALAMLPEAWRPAGSASGTGVIGGTTDAPRATATITTGMLVVGVQHVDTARAELRVSADAVEFDRVEVTQGDGRFDATGRYAWTTGAYTAQLEGRGLVIEDALGSEAGTRARVDLTFTGEGTVEAPVGEGRATIDFEGGTAGGLVGRTTVDVRLDGVVARVHAHAPGLGTYLDGTVSPLAPYDYRAVAVVDRLDLAPLALVGGAHEDAVTGTLSLTVLLTGQASDAASLVAAINLQQLDALANGVPVTLAAPSRLRYDAAGVSADDVTLRVGTGELHASGRFSEELTSEWRTTLEANAAELVTLAQAFVAVPAEIAARGAVRLDWRSTGGLQQTEGTLTLADGALIYDDLPPVEDVAIRATFDGETVDVPEMTGTWQGGGIEGSARLPRALFEDEAPAAEGHGFLKMRLRGLAPGALAPWMDAATLARMTGRLSATLDAVIESPSVEGLRGTLVLDEAAMTVDGVPIEQRQPSRLALEDGQLRMTEVQWMAGGSPLQLTGAVDLTTEDPALDLALTGRADLRIASAFDPTIATDGGADLDIRIGGVASAPLFDGRITLDGAELAMRDPQLLLSNVHGRIDLNGDRIVFQEITGDANGGRLVIVGGLTHSAFELTGGTVILQVQGAALEYPQGLQSEADALLQFVPGPGAPRLFGDVRILRSGYLSPISLPAIIAANRAQARPIRAEPAYLDTVRLNIAVETVTDMVVDNNYGRFEAGAQVRIVGTVATPGMVGRAELREGGQMYLAGNTFRIERGSISFIGQSTIEPDFDIEVRTQASGQDVTVTLSGTLDRLETDVRSSNPDVPADELVSLLLGGTGAGFGGADALRLFSAELLGATGRAFGLDSVRLERDFAGDDLRADPGLFADQADPSARLTLSKRLRPDVEVILSQNLRESGLSAIVSYRPRRNVELRGITRDNQDRAYSVRHEITFGGGGAPAAARALPEPRVSAVTVTGPVGDEGALASRLRLGPGDRFNFHTWQRDIDTLRTHFHAQGRFEARVRATRQEDEAAGTVALTYRVEPGPATRIETAGYEVSSRLRRDLERAWTRAVFDQFLIQELQLQVRRHLIDRGYFGGTVGVEVDVTDDETAKVARLVINPGTKVSGHDLRFEGRQGVDEGLLRAAIEGAGLETDGWVTPARLRQPVEDVYALEGYLDARIDVGVPALDGDRAVLPITIVEGPRYRVGGVAFEGVDAARLDDVRRDVRLDPEDPYTADVIERARRRIEDRYLRRGFNAVRVDLRPVLDEPAARVAVTFLVDEGPQQVLAEVTTSGASRTREGVVERALRLRVGEPVDLNEWALGRKRLYDTNVFRQVDLQVQSLGEPVDGIERVRAAVTVQEWPAWRLRYGLQVNDERFTDEEESFRAIEEAGGRTQTVGLVGDLRSQNLFGRAIGSGVNARLEPSRQSANTYIALPALFRIPVTTNLFVFGDRQTYDISDLLTFVNDRTGASLEQRWRRTRTTQVSWSYRFERSRTYDPDPDPNDEFPLDLMFDVARLSLTTLIDRRDDPFNARRGWFTSASFEYAAPEIGSDLRLAKLFAQQKLFRPVGPFVLAAAFQGGAAFADDLIPSERFRAGGGYTVRGFEENSLGPLDFLGRPRGGNALLILNQEVRFPLFRWARAVAFLDMGNVFSSREELSFNNLKVGYGVGLRLDTPFALLRIDYGIPTDRRPGDPRGRWYFGIGQVF